jgi:hypothetical protein
MSSMIAMQRFPVSSTICSVSQRPYGSSALLIPPAFKSQNHLFKLSLAHAIAQSTKLSIYEATMQESLALTSSFPKELSMTGHLQMTRREALKMTGRLFTLRMDVNLIGGILGQALAALERPNG